MLSSLFDFFRQTSRYREFLKQSVARDLRKQYKRSVLGYIWSMLHPLLMMIILSAVFSQLVRMNIEHYPVFLFAGMLPFNFFSGAVVASLGSIRQYAPVLEQIKVPKYLFTVSVCTSQFVTFLLSLLPLFAVMLFLGKPVPASVLFLPIMLIPLFLFTLGVALILSAANVFFDDTQHLTTVLMQALYFVCPILYSRELLPETTLPILLLNPLFHLVEQTRDLFYAGTLPSPELFGSLMLVGTVSLVLGLEIYRRADQRMLYHV